MRLHLTHSPVGRPETCSFSCSTFVIHAGLSLNNRFNLAAIALRSFSISAVSETKSLSLGTVSPPHPTPDPETDQCEEEEEKAHKYCSIVSSAWRSVTPSQGSAEFRR